MNEATRQALIAKYAEGPAVLRAAIANLTPEELDRSPGPGEWSPRQIVHHTADSEMTSAIRLRRLIAEESPVIHGYDQDLFADKLHYDRPIEPSLAAVEAARQTTLDILTRLTPEDWSRAGTHSETRNTYGVQRWLEIYAAHCHDHADQIRRAVASAAVASR